MKNMKKANPKEPKTMNTYGWIEVEPKGPATESGAHESLEVRIGSCVVSVPPKFDRVSFTEVCKALLNL